MTPSNIHSASTGDILIVGDNKSGLKLLSDILKKAGYTVQPASDGDQALRSVQAKRPSLILLGTNMPNLDGYEVCRRLKDSKDTQDIPVIFISIKTSPMEKVKAFEVGGVDYISKPFEPEEILARVATHLALWKAQKEIEEKNLQLQQKIVRHKRAEEALRQSEEKYRSLTNDVLDSSNVGIFILDSKFRIAWMNRALERYFGLKRDEIVGMDKRKLIRERIAGIFQDPENFVEKVLATYDNNTYIEHFECHVLPDGDREERWLKHWSQPIRTGLYAGGRVEHYTDITNLKLAEEKLKKSEARLRSVFQVSPLGIGLVQNRQLVWHNETMSRMLGYSSEELHGKNARMLYQSDEEYERVGEVTKTLGPEKRTTEVETRWVRKDGSVFDCHIWYTLMDTESEDKEILAIAEDLMERKKAEQEKKRLEAQLNQAQKMEAIGVLAGGVAHDFNNILTAIIGNAELALMKLGKDIPGHQNIEEIRRAGQRAAALTRQLLAFSRKELIRPEILDLNQVTMNLEKMLRRIIGEDIELVTVYAPDLWQVEADPGQMEQVMMNLSVNARDAMPKGGTLTIETANVELDEAYFRKHGAETVPGPYVMLAVTDSGAGIDKETQARIFEPFFTTKGMGRGTGLGLSTVYGIVKQNKGHIWVYSEPGKGTTFKVYLPKAKADTRGVEKEQSKKRPLNGSETILVAEDDEALRNMTREMLEGYGYNVITARDGKEAIKISDSHDNPIHLLLTDVVMPGMSGRDLAEKLQSRFQEMKVLYMSGYTSNTITHHGTLEKDVAFIQKPFTQEGLAGKVREVLDKKTKLNLRHGL